MSSRTEPAQVIVLGGGIAGVEAVLALNDLAPEQLSVTLVSADRDFLFKPLAVEEPFSGNPPEQHDLEALMSELGVAFVQARATAVRLDEHIVELEGAEDLRYDALLVALGARISAPFEGARVLDPRKVLAVDDAIREAAESASGKLAIVIPSGPAWPLPAYELALQTCQRAEEKGVGLKIELVTPEERPLGVFGAAASDAVAELLRGRGIDVRTSTRLEQAPGGELIRHPGGERYTAGAILALPLLGGPGLSGLPHDESGFIPIDAQAQVMGTRDVWAAGDGTNFPIKQGGLAAAQADAAAEGIAHRFGAPIEAKPFEPVLRGQLLTGADSLHMRHEAVGGRGEGVVSGNALWWPPSKVVGRYLPAILEHEGIEYDPAPPREPLDVELALGEDWQWAPHSPILEGRMPP